MRKKLNFLIDNKECEIVIEHYDEGLAFIIKDDKNKTIKSVGNPTLRVEGLKSDEVAIKNYPPYNEIISKLIEDKVIEPPYKMEKLVDNVKVVICKVLL